MDAAAHHIGIALAGGIAATGHCVGMCGGFVLHLSREADGRRMMTQQILWHCGRLSSYLFLGAVAGFAGGMFQLFLLRHALWQNLLSLSAAAMIFLAGLRLMGLLPVRREGGILGSVLFETAAGLFNVSSPGGALAMGIGTGFLPCPVVVAFIAYAVQTGSVPVGMATMAALGAGSALPLLLVTGAARCGTLRLRTRGAKAGGCILILLAFGTALRGTEIYHRLVGCPPRPVLHESCLAPPPQRLAP